MIFENESDSSEENDEIEIRFGAVGIFGIVSAYILPFIIINNLITNVTIIALCTYLSTSKRAIVFYITIALSDLAPTLEHYLLDVFLSDGLKYMTKDQIKFEFNEMSDIVCRVQWLVFGITLQFCNWILAILSFERLLIV